LQAHPVYKTIQIPPTHSLIFIHPHT
jgi:hypothetical protein